MKAIIERIGKKTPIAVVGVSRGLSHPNIKNVWLNNRSSIKKRIPGKSLISAGRKVSASYTASVPSCFCPEKESTSSTLT